MKTNISLTAVFTVTVLVSCANEVVPNKADHARIPMRRW